MVLSNITLTTSDVIDLIGIFASLFIGVIAIIISILSLRQNSKMIEESTRPNIQIYPVFLDDFFISLFETLVIPRQSLMR